MALQNQTLRPGFLVSLKTSCRGNVSYQKTELEGAHLVEGTGAQKARWETTRLIADPDEHERAAKARSEAARKIRSVCTHSAFGLLCPESDAEKLEAAIKAAREIADAFNDTATLSRVTVYVMTGRIAADDVEAVRAINGEIRDLMDSMQDGIKRLDVKAIREAASRAKEIGAMLPADAQARVQIAVETARAAATNLVKAGETAAKEVDQSAIRKITDMRTAFLDLDADGKPVEAPKAEARGVDFDVAPAKAGTFIERSQPREVEV